MTDTVILPWPTKALHPNARVHWAKLSRAKADYRFACSTLTRQAGIKFTKDDKLHVGLVFYAPDKRRRDLDGMLSACKAGLDGVADAIGCDDHQWTISMSVAQEIGGYVRVSIQRRE